MCAKLDRMGLVADMTYVVFQGEAAAGRERCHLHRRAGGGYWLSADLDLASPFLHHEYIEVGTSSHWLPESLLVRLSGNVARDATFRPDGLALRATIVSD